MANTCILKTRWQIQKHSHTTSVATKSPELMNLFLRGTEQEQILSFSPLTFTYSNYPLSSTSVGCLLLNTWFILNHISPHTLHPCTQLHRSIMAFYRFACLSSSFFSLFFFLPCTLHCNERWLRKAAAQRRGRAFFLTWVSRVSKLFFLFFFAGGCRCMCYLEYICALANNKAIWRQICCSLKIEFMNKTLFFFPSYSKHQERIKKDEPYKVAASFGKCKPYETSYVPQGVV